MDIVRNTTTTAMVETNTVSEIVNTVMYVKACLND